MSGKGSPSLSHPPIDKATSDAKPAAIRHAEKHRNATCSFADRVAQLSIKAYEVIKKQSAINSSDNEAPQTCIAAFLVLDKDPPKHEEGLSPRIAEEVLNGECLRVVAVGQGTKFLPCAYYDSDVTMGRRLHDCHAEVLARRCLLQYFHRQIRSCVRGQASIFVPSNCEGMLKLRDSVTIHMYSSSTPCGNASIKKWAKAAKEKTKQDLGPFEYPAAGFHPKIGLHAVREGQICPLLKRDPTEATDPLTEKIVKNNEGIPTGTVPFTGRKGQGRSMTCSDKILRWNCLGLEGGLLRHFIHRVRMDTITVGRKFSRAHSERAFCCRMQGFEGLWHPSTLCTSVHFDVGAMDAESGARFSDLCRGWAEGWGTEVIFGMTGMALQGDSSTEVPSGLSRSSLFQEYLETTGIMTKTKPEMRKCVFNQEQYSSEKERAPDEWYQEKLRFSTKMRRLVPKSWLVEGQ